MFESSEEFLAILTALPSSSEVYQDIARERQLQLTKPEGSLGLLEEIAIWLAGWQQREEPRAELVQALVFAGNHGIVDEGVSPFPAEVTAQMVANFKAGGAAINVLTNLFGHKLAVIPIELNRPTANFAKEPAMSGAETLHAINIGADAVLKLEADFIYFGEMGIGNTTSAAAIAAAVFGGTGVDWAGPGTGLDEQGVKHKAEVIERALNLHRSHADNAFTIMQHYGGRELAAIMGGVAAARIKRLPVIIDGYVVTAAVAPMMISSRDALDHCIAAHCSAEPAHRQLLDALSLVPILELDMRLGEGTGAAIAAELVKAAGATHNHMATFTTARISGPDD